MIFIAFQGYYFDIQFFAYFGHQTFETYFYVMTKKYLSSVPRTEDEVIIDQRNSSMRSSIVGFHINIVSV